MRAPGGPRLLLRRLREVMAEPVTAQARLDRIVVLIASNMVAEVCSLYVVRADGSMELFATEGLNREAVHLTTMRPGEGLVGLIVSSAEPLALSDAQHHPAFSYTASRPNAHEFKYGATRTSQCADGRPGNFRRVRRGSRCANRRHRDRAR